MKKMRTYTLLAAGVLLLIASTLTTAVARGPIESPKPGTMPGDGDAAMTPPSITVDRVIHNLGAISTTVDNFGLIGYWDHYGYPSGEWPTGSRHNYLAEINYWMGAVTQGGDTLVASTWNDFMAEPSLVAGTPEFAILFSTDTNRYYNYNPDDTVGEGIGNPAEGWKVWDAKTQKWIYQDNYVPSLDSMLPGGPVAIQESHYLFNDAASNVPKLGLEMTHTVLQWNYCYNEDFMFMILEITNRSGHDFDNFCFGLYVDLDVGGPTPDGEDEGRLGDLVAFDSTENLGWIYDADGYDPGWGRLVKTGIMGTKYLETPNGVGMTAFRSGQWDSLPDYDAGMYELINSQRFDTATVPFDQYYIMCTRGITLQADSTVRVVYALIAGEDEADYRNNASLAQYLYDNYFIGPEPPPMPTLRAQASDERVHLYWDDTSQVAVDPLSGENDFAGYKLYRSDNQGKTWGIANLQTGNDCLTKDYIPIATFQVANPTDLIQRSFIDTGLINGVEYWYSLVAFDTGASQMGVSVLQDGWGMPGSSRNTVSVTPRTDPAGFYETAGTVHHEYTGTWEPSDGDCLPAVYDRTQLTGSEYEVVFEDTQYDTYWHLINMTTGDTVLADQTFYAADSGTYPVVEGLRVFLSNPERMPRSMGQTSLGGADTTLIVTDVDWYGPGVPAILAGDTSFIFSDVPYRAAYELRVTGTPTLAPAVDEYIYGPGPTYTLPFEIWNISSNTRVSAAVYDFATDGVFDPYDLICIVNYPYGDPTELTAAAFPFDYSWLFGFDYTIYNPTVGDVYTIEGPRLNGPDDVFSFKADGINAAVAKVNLNKIRVVPDPYYANAPKWEVSEGEHVIQFQNVPDQCTIRIYTLAGDLVATLENTDGSGTVEWDLLTSGHRLISSGIYLYHVESRYGERLGRFAVIK